MKIRLVVNTGTLSLRAGSYEANLVMKTTAA